MKLVAGEAIPGPKQLDRCSQYGFLPAQPLRLGFDRRNIRQELTNERGDGCVLLCCFHAGTAVDIVIHGNCDIFHSYTVSQFCGESNTYQKAERDPLLSGEVLFQAFEQRGGQIPLGEGRDDHNKVFALVLRAAADLYCRCQRCAR